MTLLLIRSIIEFGHRLFTVSLAGQQIIFGSWGRFIYDQNFRFINKQPQTRGKINTREESINYPKLKVSPDWVVTSRLLFRFLSVFGGDIGPSPGT